MESIFTNFKVRFLYADKYDFPKTWVYPKDTTPYCMFRYILSGKGIFKLNDKEYLVEKGDVFYYPQGCEIECWAIENISFISIRFVGTVSFNKCDLLKDLFGIKNIYKSCNDETKDLFIKTYECMNSPQKNRVLRIKSYLYGITASLSTDCEVVDSDKIPDPKTSIESLAKMNNTVEWDKHKFDIRISVIVDYLASHPSENLTIDRLCEIVKMSESSFRRHFKMHTGKSPKEYIQEQKMAIAARMIMSSSIRISEVAYQLGFDSANYFARVFKKTYGISPLHYRIQSNDL